MTGRTAQSRGGSGRFVRMDPGDRGVLVTVGDEDTKDGLTVAITAEELVRIANGIIPGLSASYEEPAPRVPTGSGAVVEYWNERFVHVGGGLWRGPIGWLNADAIERYLRSGGVVLSEGV